MSYHVREDHVIDLVTLRQFPPHRLGIVAAVNAGRDAKRLLRRLGRLPSNDTAAARAAYKQYMADSGKPEPVVEYVPPPFTPLGIIEWQRGPREAA